MDITGEISVELIVGRAKRVKVIEKWTYQFSEKWLCEVRKSDTLAVLRRNLMADKHMLDHDIFLNDGEPVGRNRESVMVIDDVTDKVNEPNIILIANERWG